MDHTERYVVITGTNRPKSNSEVLARAYVEKLHERGVRAELLLLKDLPRDFAYTDMWDERSPEMTRVIDKVMVPAGKFVFVIPEYNGGFPGVLKSFIDIVPPATFHGKKAGLVGLSSGKAGALRPMDQFSNVLNYLKVNVLFMKPKLSEVDRLLTDDGQIDERALSMLAEHVQHMIDF